jgi:hypothetical protein
MNLSWPAFILPALVAAAPLARAAEEAPAQRTPAEPQVLNQVTEDDNVRIEELRVRGQTRRLTVKPKIPGMNAYEIAAPEPGRGPATPRCGRCRPR